MFAIRPGAPLSWRLGGRRHESIAPAWRRRSSTISPKTTGSSSIRYVRPGKYGGRSAINDTHGQLTAAASLRDNWRMRTVLKSGAVHLALLAMVLRAVLPAGWMPAAITSANASPFVICTMDGPLHSAPAKPSSNHDTASAPCVFAASVHAATPTAEPVDLSPATLASHIAFSPHHESVATAPQFRPNTARAPPASV